MPSPLWLNDWLLLRISMGVLALLLTLPPAKADHLCDEDSNISSAFNSNPLQIFPPNDTTIACEGLPLSSYLPAVTGMATTLDGCGGETIFHVDSIEAGCGLSGTILRTWFAYDTCGELVNALQQIHIIDTLAPVLTCNPFTLSLDSTGQADLSAQDLAQIQADLCGNAFLTVFPSQLDCSHLGVTSVTVFATDDCGNQNSCQALITVIDDQDPIALCQDQVAYLNTSGFATVTPDDIDAGSSDPCGILQRSLNQTLFDCDDLGSQTVTLTVIDSSFNGNTCISQLTVLDTLGPVLICKDTNLVLGSDNTVSLDPLALVDFSYDACGLGSFFVDQSEFNCTHIGLPSSVTLVATDQNSNISTCQSTVTVTDSVAPSIQVPANLTIEALPGACSGMATYTVLGSDNCDSVSVAQIAGPGNGPGSNLPIGQHTITFAAYDLSGNESVDSFQITVIPYQSPLDSVFCVDTLFIEMNPFDCIEEIHAAQLLVGGPYSCSNDYGVSIFAPGNISLGNVITGDFVGIPLTAFVSDPNSGNNCQSFLIASDTTPPTLQCTDLAISCLDSTHPDSLINQAQTHLIPYSGPVVPLIDGCQGTLAGTEIPFNVNAAGFISDINVSLFVEHQWVGDVSAALRAPDGTTVMLFERPGTDDDKCYDTFINEGNNGDFGSSEDDIQTTFDQQAVNSATDFENLSVPGMGGTYQPIQNLSVFNNKPAAGVWTLIIYDGVGGGQQIGTFITGLLEISAGFPQGPGAWDACGSVTLSHDDTILPGACTDDFIRQVYRLWTAKDESANITFCPQIITIYRPYLEHVTLPIDLSSDTFPSLDCQSTNPDPAITGYPVLNGTPLSNGGPCNMQVSYQDSLSFPCPGAMIIYRTWTISDDCTADQVEGVQLITLLDNEAPTLECPASMIIEAGLDCTGVLDLPNPVTLADNCSDSLEVIVYDNNNFPYQPTAVLTGLELGFHTFIYEANDGCGNTSAACVFEVEVLDNNPPDAICKDTLTVVLNQLGQGNICATQANDSSFDNCGILSYKVKRADAPANTPFSNCINLDCSDLGQAVTGRLRVYDKLGTFNEIDPDASFGECNFVVTVIDSLAPFLACPSNVSYDCGTFNPDTFPEISPIPPGAPAFFNGNLIGYYNGVVDNCDGVIITISQFSNIANCGQGTYTRIYTAEDPSGNTSNCAQVITIANGFPFYITDQDCSNSNPNDGIIWPCDLSLSGCGLGIDPLSLALHPDNFVAQNAFPELFESSCDLLGSSHQDTYLPGSGNSCYEVQRTWTIIDWCQPDPSTPSGYATFTYVQNISVLNSQSPSILSSCSDAVFCNTTNDCSAVQVDIQLLATDDCTPDSLLVIHQAIDLLNDGNVDIQATGSLLSGFYPNGTHKVTWTVTDGCGLTTSCSQLFTIQDCLAPVAACVGGLTSVFMPSNGTLSLSADYFESGISSDNCTPYSQLTFSFSPDPSDTVFTFTCNELGINNISLWVTDEAGNNSSCQAVILLQDPNNNCFVPLTTFDVGGEILTEISTPIAAVEISANTNQGMFNSMVTGLTGTYNFSLDSGLNYTLIPKKDINYDNGITTFDLVKITQHILQAFFLDSPYKIIAADASNDGNITNFDIILLQNIILFNITDLPNNDSWRFVETAYSFPDPMDPFISPFPEDININNLAGSSANNDFVGIKVGDVDNSANPSQYNGNDTRSGIYPSLDFIIQDQYFMPDETLEIPIRAKDFTGIQGFQFTMSFDTNLLEIIDLQKKMLPNFGDRNVGYRFSPEGQITVSWHSNTPITIPDEQILCTLFMRSKKSGYLSNGISISSQYTEAQAYREEEQFLRPAFQYLRGDQPITSSVDVLELYPPSPNPFIQHVQMPFFIPDGGLVELEIMDASGRNVLRESRYYPRGKHSFTLSSDVLPSAGLYIYSIRTPFGDGIGKLIFSP